MDAPTVGAEVAEYFPEGDVDRVFVGRHVVRLLLDRDRGSWAGSDGSGDVGFFFGRDFVDQDVGEVVVTDFEDDFGGFHALGVAFTEAGVDLDLHLGLPSLLVLGGCCGLLSIAGASLPNPR